MPQAAEIPLLFFVVFIINPFDNLLHFPPFSITIEDTAANNGIVRSGKYSALIVRDADRDIKEKEISHSPVCDGADLRIIVKWR